jgi:hypothetical protein
MKSLSAKDVTRLGELADGLRGEWSEVESTRDELSEAIDRINEAIGGYNKLRQEAQDFVEELASKAQAYADERSEKWADGEAGTAYMEWIDLLTIQLDEVDEVSMDSLDFPVEPEHAEELENLPQEPSD